MPDNRVLVVGTTPDYIAYINEKYPDRALFLTDHSQRKDSRYPAPEAGVELLADLIDTKATLELLAEHLEEHNQKLSGVVGYDCEWLRLAAIIAFRYRLPYPSEDTINLSRDKYRCKLSWKRHDVLCPEVELVHNAAQALSLHERLGSEIVLKPLTGSGSELTFVCHDSYDLGIAYRSLVEGLTRRSQEPMYCAVDSGVDHRLSILAEQYIEGREYSADFIVEEGNVRIVRLARKIKDESLPFGTTLGYSVPASLPGWLSENDLASRLGQAARALGIHRAICMADLMITHDQLYFIELTPRIGGDCLPSLVRASAGIDTIGLALDFAEKLPTFIPPREEWKAHIGLRLLATEAGVLASAHGRALAKDARVKEIYFKHEPGHEITLPPADYSSWVLGHVIFEADPNTCPKEQCDDISSKMSINVEQYRDQKLSWFHDDGGRTVQPSGPAA